MGGPLGGPQFGVFTQAALPSFVSSQVLQFGQTVVKHGSSLHMPRTGTQAWPDAQLCTRQTLALQLRSAGSQTCSPAQLTVAHGSSTQVPSSQRDPEGQPAGQVLMQTPLLQYWF